MITLHNNRAFPRILQWNSPPLNRRAAFPACSPERGDLDDFRIADNAVIDIVMNSLDVDSTNAGKLDVCCALDKKRRPPKPARRARRINIVINHSSLDLSSIVTDYFCCA